MADDTKKHLHDLVDDFKTAMLVTHAADGELRARPMMIADTEDGGDLWFATDVASAKVDEIAADPRVNVCLQGDDAYVSLTGTAQVINDRTKVDELWSDAWKVWFEDKDDPNLVLLKVHAREGEYWDNRGGNKLKYAFQAAKGFFTGDRPDPDASQSTKVSL